MNGVLSRHGTAWLARHGAPAVLVLFVLSRALGLWFLGPDADTQHYLDLANRWFAGAVPYRDFVLEYPPASLWFMALPRLLTSQDVLFARVFMGLAIVAELVCGLALWRLLAPDGNAPSETQQAHRTTQLLVLTVASAFLQEVTLRRTDVFAAAALLWALALLRRPLSPAWGGAALGLGAAIKLFPALVAPLLLTWVWQRAALAGPARRPLRDVAMFVAAAAAVFAATFVPLGSALLEAPATMLTYHGERPLQLESTYAALVLVLDAVLGLDVTVQFHHHAFHLDGPISTALGNAAPFILVLAVIAANAWGVRRVRAAPAAQVAHVTAQAAAAVLLAAILTHKTLSPQYLAWVVPLWAVHAIRPPRVTLLDHSVLLLACLLTPILYPLVYPLLIQKDLLSILILAARNTLLWVMLFRLLESMPRELQHRRPARPATLLLVMWTAFFVWQCLLDFRPHYNGDLLLHLRIGQDILDNAAVPRVDVYSGLVAGEPFVAHEWLAAVLFNRADALAGGTGLTLLVVWLAFLTLLALWLSLEPGALRSPLVLPLFVAGAYVLAARTHARPHVIALLLEALWVYAFSQWRRDRRWANLVWLVPMQVVWANSHGSFVLGPALLGVLAVGVALEATGDVTARVAAAAQPMSMAAVTLVASLANPYGPRLFLFSVGMGVDSAHIRQAILEWRPIWDDAFADDIWTWVWAALLVLAWSGVLLAGARRMVLDVVVLAFATALVSQAVRFAPDFVLLSLPVTVRAWSTVARPMVRPRFWRPGVFLHLPVLAAMLVFVLKHGAVVAAGQYMALGSGMMMDQLPTEVEVFRSTGLHGKVFNEYEDGAPLILALHPEVLPMVDMRIDLFGAARWRDYQRALQSPDALVSYLDAHGVDHVLLQRTAARQPLLNRLVQTGRWAVVANTPTRTLLTRAPQP